MAGTVYSVGEGVTGFERGDRVVGMHRMRGAGGAYAEFGVAPGHTTFSLGKGIGFEGSSLFFEAGEGGC